MVSQVMNHLRRNGLEGQKARSPGHRPGYKSVGDFALKGQKPTCCIVAFALSGRWLRTPLSQGDALGYREIAPLGRTCET